ncbi:MAG: LamG domain-containing protein [Niabella sp.]
MEKNNILIKSKAWTFLAVIILMSSCYKKFDEKSYAPPFTINGYTSSSEIAASNLVAYWSFEGDLKESVSGNVGENKGTSFAQGFIGQGLKGALNSYVLTDASNALSSLKSFTLSEWVNTPPPSSGIIGLFTLANTTTFWGNIELFVENGSTNENGKLRLHVSKGGNDYTFEADNVLNLFNKWVNITYTYDETTSMFALYVNGSKVKSGTLNNLTGALDFTNIGKVVFGCVQFQTNPSQTSAVTSQDWASFLTGQIDEVRVYNKVLDDKEISSLIVLQGKGY